jgi:peptide-methionine (R)-S-oxide reductase
VEKFVGDAVMAAFGAPAALEDHAERALHAALGMQRRLRELFGDRLALRIGAPRARRETASTLIPMPKIEKSEQEWREELTPEQYRVLREKGTEAPFSGEYDHTFEPGTYRCAGCGAELFESDAKYDSGCGWPAFSAPAGEDKVDEETDTAYGMVRTEVLCASCGGHLGHVFPDGPHPTGLRYCINSAALELDEK